MVISIVTGHATVGFLIAGVGNTGIAGFISFAWLLGFALCIA
jgi:hypothetical protein